MAGRDPRTGGRIPRRERPVADSWDSYSRRTWRCLQGSDRSRGKAQYAGGRCVRLTRRRCRKITDSKHTFPIAPNLLITAQGPDESWVTDITFLWTRQGWLYLAVILDLFSRRVVGWATSQSVDRTTSIPGRRLRSREKITCAKSAAEAPGWQGARASIPVGM